MKQLRMLAIAMMAIAALSAVVAQGASAAGKFGIATGESYPAAIEGNQTGEGGENIFKVENDTLEVKCPVANFGGGEISAESAEVKGVTAEYKGEGEKVCKAFGINATVSMNTCTYTFKSETEVESEMKYTGKASVACGATPIKVVTATCEVQIGAQTGLGPITYVVDTKTPAEKNDTTIIPGISKSISYTETKDGIGCPLTHLNVPQTDGSYTGVVTGKCVDPVTHVRKECQIRP